MAVKGKIQNHYEVIIVGAGPAGLATGKILARLGKEVLILESQNKIGLKICAGGLTSKDLLLGIPDDLIAKKFQAVTLYTNQRKLKLKGRRVILSTIDREDLGWWQQSQSVHPNLTLYTGREVTRIEKDHIIVGKDQKIEYDVLVGADGSNSIVRKYLEIPTEKILVAMQYKVPGNFDDLELYFNAKKYGITYLWIFPHKNYASIGIGVDLAFKKNTAEVKQALDSFMKDKGYDLKKCTFESHPINYDYRGFAFGNIFLVGDAGGFASGATGEGIYSAMLSGKEVAERIFDYDYDTPKLKVWLKDKKRQEKILRLCQKAEPYADKIADFLLPHIKHKYVQNLILKITNTL